MCPSRHSLSRVCCLSARTVLKDCFGFKQAQARYDLLRHARPCSGTIHLAQARCTLLRHAALPNLRALLGFYISEMFLILSIFCDTRHSPELPHSSSPCTLLCDTSSVWEAERKTEIEIFSSFFNISRVDLRCSPSVNISVTAVDDSSLSWINLTNGCWQSRMKKKSNMGIRTITDAPSG